MESEFLRFPGGRSRALTFSYDDGPREDLRLAGLFDRYGMKATFNLSSAWIGAPGRLTENEIREHLLEKGHEIAVHTAHHRAPGKLRPAEGIAEVLDCRRELERRFGVIVRGMAYPNAGITHFSPGVNYAQVKNYLTGLGVAYARTLAGDNDGFFLPDDWHAWVPSAHHDNPHMFEYSERFLSLAPEKRRGDCGMPRLMYIWGHSFEFENKKNWDRMEKICMALAGNEDIWYATNIEIYDYVNACLSLVRSADGTVMYNPTVTDVHLWVDDAPVRVPAGGTVKL